MTDEEYKERLEGLFIANEQLTEKVNRMDKRLNHALLKTSKQIKEKDEYHKHQYLDRDEREKRFDTRLDKIAKMVGGISNNNGDVAENFFYRGLKHYMELGGYKFNWVKRNFHVSTREMEGQYDIILTNNDTIIVVEVKYKVHPDDVDDFYLNNLPKFKILFPYYKDYKMFGAIAGMDIPEDAINKAKEYGLFVLTQAGKNIELLNYEMIRDM